MLVLVTCTLSGAAIAQEPEAGGGDEAAIRAANEGWLATAQARDAELHRLAGIPWDQEPNRAPCTSWRSCGRSYELVEYDLGSGSWRLLRRSLAFEISAEGVRWSEGVEE